jgi:dipeptidyl-peptidase 4
MLIPLRFAAGLVAALSTCLLFAPPLRADGSKDDYDRAAALREHSRNKVFHDRVTPNWINGGKQFWYEVTTGPGQREWMSVDAEKGERKPAFDHAKLAATLAEATGQSVDAAKLPLTNFRLAGDAQSAQFSALGKRWKYDVTAFKLEDVGAEKEVRTTVTVLEQPHPSPEGGAKTSIRFLNHTTGPVKLITLDAGGERSEAGTVEADQEKEQSTATGHVWIVTDRDDRPLGMYEATEKAGVAVVENALRPQGFGRGGGGFRGGRGGALAQAQSPDGKWRAEIKENNLVVRNLKNNDEETKLTSDGNADDPYLNRFSWSPNSTKLVAIQEKVGETHKVYTVESSPKDQVQPKLHTQIYAKPGNKLPVARPRLFDVAAGKQILVSEELFPNAWSVSDYRWAPDSSRFSFLYNQRGHQVLRIVGVDAATGVAKPIVDEHSATFIDYSGKMFSQYFDDTNEIIWMSERDGWNHLYLYDSKTGEVKNQITRGPWVVRGVDFVDREKRQIWFRAGGIRAEQDPYYIHYCRVNFDGSGMVVLTAGDGTHDVEFSPDRKFLIDTFSRVDMPPVVELRRSEDGSLVCGLEKADAAELIATGWRAPERFVAKARDGETDIYGIILRPTNFDPNKKYPVIEKIYAGPQGSFVPKAFYSSENRGFPGTPIYEGATMAELGFIVVQIDGMGTSNRSKKFHDVCAKNLVDAGFPDRILWMQAAAKKYPQMDLTRVGIYGTSAGGQNALGGLLTHPEFYKAGMADCGCHDNRMDKVWWNEQWMSWPIGPEYDSNSNVTLAPKLQGKLLLIVGELDTNVDPASTMQVVNALIKADKDFELLVVPGADHGAGASTPYGQRRIRDFFVRSLLGKEPRWVSQGLAANNE